MLSLQLGQISDAIRAGRDYDLHCHSMSLRATRGALPSFDGPGSIQIGQGGKVRFTLYCDSCADDPERDRGLAGELISDEEIYRLVAIDSSGFEWTAVGVVDVRIQPNKDKSKSVLTGSLPEVQSSRPIFPEGVTTRLPEMKLTMHVFGKVDIPLNTRTVTKKHVDGDEFPTGGARLDVARFEAGDHKFSLTHADDLLEIRVEAPSLAPALDKRVIESLQFVLARPVWWTILCEERGDTIIARIRSAPPNQIEESHLPPIESVYLHDRTKCVWVLFAKYFDHIRSHDAHSWHPLSRYLYSAIEAHAAGFDTYRLAIGVAVEGILKTAFKKLGAPSDRYVAAIDSLAEFVREWKCPDAECQDSIRTRIERFVPNLKDPSGTDRLRALVDNGVLTTEEFDAWKGLRNKTAHADRPDRLPTQKEIDQIDRVITLTHKLVFQAIGYSGKYTDYGTRGFPTRDFVPAV